MFKLDTPTLTITQMDKLTQGIGKQEEFQPPAGNTPVVLPWDNMPEIRVFSNIKQEKFDKLAEYFEEWFTELCLIEGVYLGGGCLRTLINEDDVICDIDLFFRDKVALDKATKVMEKYDNEYYVAFQCPANELTTYKSGADTLDEDRDDDFYKSQRKIQFITKSFYTTPQELVSSFDFVATCACLYNGEVYTHKGWLKSVKKKQLDLNFVSYPVATINRMFKYKEKGFYIPSSMLVQLVQEINDGVFDDDRLALYVD